MICSTEEIFYRSARIARYIIAGFTFSLHQALKKEGPGFIAFGIGYTSGVGFMLYKVFTQ